MTLRLAGSTSGYTEIDAPAVAGSNTIVLPSGNGSANQLLKNGSTAGSLEFSSSVYIDSSQRLLVGTSTSTGDPLLVVHGRVGSATEPGTMSLRRGGTVLADYNLGQLDFTDGSNNVAARINGASESGWGGSGDSPGRLVFSTTADGASSPTERAKITSAGYFAATNDGTYVNAGATYHELSTSAANWGLVVKNRTPSADYYCIRVDSSTAKNNASAILYDGLDGGTLRFRVYSNGGIANYQSNNSNLSDQREKKNIIDLDSTWDCLKHWELKKFHYKEDADTDDQRYGVIAQQVAEYCPEVITDWVKQEAKEAVLDDDGNEIEPAKEEIVRMGVKEQQMMWMAIKALQEAQLRIETLEAANAALESRIAALEVTP